MGVKGRGRLGEGGLLEEEGGVVRLLGGGWKASVEMLLLGGCKSLLLADELLDSSLWVGSWGNKVYVGKRGSFLDLTCGRSIVLRCRGSLRKA